MILNFRFLCNLLATLLACILTLPAFAQGEVPSQTLFTNVMIFDGVNEGLMAGL